MFFEAVKMILTASLAYDMNNKAIDDAIVRLPRIIHQATHQQVKTRRCRSSVSFEGLELGGTLRDIHGELVVRSGFDHSGVDHLRHQVRGHLASFVVLLQGHHLLLELMDLLEPSLVLGFLEGRSFLVGLDLSESASPLAADLQHVGGDSF